MKEPRGLVAGLANQDNAIACRWLSKVGAEVGCMADCEWKAQKKSRTCACLLLAGEVAVDIHTAVEAVVVALDMSGKVKQREADVATIRLDDRRLIRMQHGVYLGLVEALKACP